MEKIENISKPNYIAENQNWSVKNIGTFNVLLGKNGSGKSTLLRRINKKSPQKTHYVSPEKNGAINVDNNIAENEETSSERANNRTKGDFNNQFYTQAFSRIKTISSKIGIHALDSNSETNIGDNIEKMQKIGDQVSKLLSLLVADLNFRFQASSEMLFTIEKDSINSDNLSTNHFSSGELQALGLAVDIATISILWEAEEVGSYTILIDEPAVHLHPELQFKLTNYLCKLKEVFPALSFIIASHNTTFLSVLSLSIKGNQNIESEPRFEFMKKGKSNIRFSNKDINSSLYETLGGHALLGSIVSSKIILVEGADDFEVWAEASRKKNFDHLVLPVPSKQSMDEYADFLDSMLSSLLGENNETKVIGIKDKDEDTEEQIESDFQGELAKIVRLNCRELENLYLTKQVLTRIDEIDSLDEVEKIFDEEEYSEELEEEYPDSVEKLRNYDRWDRKSKELKDIILHIPSIIDPNEMKWTIKLGKVLGNYSPDENDELYKYLGEELIEEVF